MANQTSVGNDAHLSANVSVGQASLLPGPVRFARGVVFGILGGACLWMVVFAIALGF